VEHGHGHAGAECIEGFRACSWSRGRFTALMVFMMDAQKDLRVDMGENFPYLGPYDRMKASTVLPGGIVVAKEFTFNPVNRYGPPRLSESEVRDVLDRRFTVERLEQTEFSVRGQVHDGIILVGVRG